MDAGLRACCVYVSKGTSHWPKKLSPQQKSWFSQFFRQEWNLEINGGAQKCPRQCFDAKKVHETVAVPLSVHQTLFLTIKRLKRAFSRL